MKMKIFIRYGTRVVITLLFFIVCSSSFFNTNAQNIAITDQEGYTPETSAMLDVYSINKGMLVPRVALVSTTNPVSGTKPEGLLVWNTSTSGSYPDPGFYYWSGTDWVKVGSSALDFENGLTHSGSTVKLGGTLSESTTITQGSYSMNFDLTGTGDFNILNNGTSAFFVRDDGYVGVGTTTPGHKLEVNGNIKLDDNIMIEGSSAYKVYRNLVSYSASSTSGAFVINTNQPQASNCMFRLKVEGYLYKSSGPLEITVGAYTTGSGSKFYNKGYVNIGSEKLAVRLAINVSTGNLAIILGDTTTTYQYPKLTVTEFCQGHSGRTESYADGWVITQETGLSGYYDYLTDVPDVTNLDNRYYTEAEVDGLISGSTFWNRTSGKLFPHILTDNVGIGTSDPFSRLEVQGNQSGNEEDPLFEVKRNDGQTVFAVYPEGVRIYVDEDVSKGSKGGFAVGGFSASKGITNEYLRITPDTVRIYVDDSGTGKGLKGGFAVGGFGTSKGLTNEYLRVTPDSVRVYVDNDPESKGMKGGFAVGGFSTGKGYEDAINFMDLTPENYFIGHESGQQIIDGKYNTFFGYQAGKNNKYGNNNIFLGYQAGFFNNSGSSNIYIGNNAGNNLNNGLYNICIGDSAGYNCTYGICNVFIGPVSGFNNSGSANTFIGSEAGRFNTIGGYNTFLGNRAGWQNTAGSYNTFLGDGSGNNHSTGNNNVFVGFYSGNGNISGSGNIFIGFDAGYNETGSDKLYIENSSTSTPLIYGDFNTDILVFNADVGINTTAPEAPLDVETNSSGYAIHLEETSTGTEDWQIGVDATGDLNFFDGTTSRITFEDGGDVGIAVSGPTNRLHVKESVNSTATPANHVALLENTSTGTSPDVLALKVGYTGNPSSAINFITFFKGDDTGVGAIEGNGSGGVTYKTSGSDYAEYLPVVDIEEKYEEGNIIGVFSGKISKITQNADVVTAISTAPAILGNDPGKDNVKSHKKVGFVGQVPVKVRGKVSSGNYIIASGKNDGTGIAVTLEEMRPTQYSQIVGIAWESSEKEDVKLIKTAIGISSWTAPLQQQQQQIISLAEQNKSQQKLIEDLQKRIEKLEKYQ